MISKQLTTLLTVLQEWCVGAVIALPPYCYRVEAGTANAQQREREREEKGWASLQRKHVAVMMRENEQTIMDCIH
jgi:hypothetical protein